MRRALSTMAGLMAMTALVHADPAAFPSFDIGKACREQADYAFAATLGQVDVAHEIDLCTANERETQKRAEAAWIRASSVAQDDCLALADGRYKRLANCLMDAGRRRTSR